MRNNLSRIFRVKTEHTPPNSWYCRSGSSITFQNCDHVELLERRS
jgi:hypothetical protein